ncbi:MAG TPA: hypothetical protein VKX16_14615 [Chloroflexota bacterium]|nr:hypothetical protein [Chloroflexota bacterium]
MCLIATSVVLVSAAGCGATHSSTGEVALVAGQPVYQTQLQTYVDYALAYYAQPSGSAPRSPITCEPDSHLSRCVTVRQQALRRLLEEQVVQHYAAAHHIGLPRPLVLALDRKAVNFLQSDARVGSLVAEHRISRQFVYALFQKEALIQSVEQSITHGETGSGPAFQVLRILFPFGSKSQQAAAYRSALTLATDGKPMPRSATKKAEWIAPFRLARTARAALASASPGGFVGPFQRGSTYLVIKLLARGHHRYGRRAREVAAARLFKAWLTVQLHHASTRCFSPGGSSVACPLT